MAVRTSYEVSKNPKFHGFLLLLSEFQKDGFELHITLGKDRKAHVSLYQDQGNRNLDKIYQAELNIKVTGFAFGFAIQNKIYSLTNVTMSAADYQDFADQAHAKAVEVGMVAPKPVEKAKEAAFTAADFPSL